MGGRKYYVVWEGRKPGIYTDWAACQAQVNGFSGARFKSYPTKEEAEKAYRSGKREPSLTGRKGRAEGEGSARVGRRSQGEGRDQVVRRSQGEESAQAGSGAPGEEGAVGRGGIRNVEEEHDPSGDLGEAPLFPETAYEEGAYEEESISVDVGTRGNPGPVEYKGVDTKTGEVIFSYGPIERGTNNLGEFLAIVHALAYLKKMGSKKTVYSDSRTAIKWVRDKKVATNLPRDASTEEMWRLVERAEKWLREHKYENKVLKWETERWGEIKADYGRK